jgi:hypothetical protein
VDEAELRRIVPGAPSFSQDFLPIAAGGQAMRGLSLGNYNALILINPGADAKALTIDLVPRPGRTIEGTILDPEGRPLSGVSAFGLTSHRFHRETLATPRFQVRALDPRQGRALVFHHKEKRLGLYREVRADEPGPLTVRLERCGAAIGRLLDPDGQPVAGTILHCDREGGIGMELGVRTDRAGRFRIDGLVAGQPYRLWYSNRQRPPYPTLRIQPGQVKDLGDGRIEPEKPGTGL